MALPLLLAGPILRRVESNLVTVWVALSEPADVSLLVWEGALTARQPDPLVTSDETETRRIGEHLHLAVVTARIPPASGKSLVPDSLYCYDLHITAEGETHDLQSLHMLRDAKAADSPDGLDHVALGYQPDRLPTFATCPSKITDLRLLYGSCRNPCHPDPDALVWIDDYVLDHLDDPRSRPHQLFLGGDQIYADDVDDAFMHLLMDVSAELIGTTADPADPTKRTPIEHALVDQVLQLKPGVTSASVDPAKPLDSYGPSADDRKLPIDKELFPPGHRLELTKRAAQFTSSDGSSHLIGLGEFAAMYLMVWSNACWRDEIPGMTFVPDATVAGAQPQPLTWSSKLTTKSRIVFPPLAFPDVVPRHLFPDPDPKPPKPDKRTPDQVQKDKERDERRRQRGLRRRHRMQAELLAGLPRVRRVLASIPTYMIFDDHEVTDDWFLNPIWRDRVLDTALGQTILTNGLAAYALFQDWGNDPLRYDAGDRRNLLDTCTQLFPAGALSGPAQPAFDRLTVLFGHDQRGEGNDVLGFRSVNPKIHWHFTVDAPTHRVIALDNRTRRSYPTMLGPPGNVSVDAMVDQVPKPPLPAGQQLLVVIAPLQVIGPPVLDSIVAPLAYRVFDLAAGVGDKYDTSARSLSGLRQMTGTHPDAIEAWAFDAPTFEHLLQLLEPYQRVVLLSGDVHNSSGSAMSYWRGNATRPARFVQFTSSGFKNVMPTMITAVDRAASFAQQMVRANLGTELLGWERPVDGMIVFPDGRSDVDLVPAMRSRLRATPVLAPTWGWPDTLDREKKETPESNPEKTSRLNPGAPPDWRWRVKPLLDERPDVAPPGTEDPDDPQVVRPESIRALDIDYDEIDAKLADRATVVSAYQRIAARHQHALGHLRNARQILFRSNFGLVRFDEPDDGVLEAVHEVYTAFEDPDNPVDERPKAAPFLLQRASLGPLDEDPPELLRATAIEPRVPEPADG